MKHFFCLLLVGFYLISNALHADNALPAFSAVTMKAFDRSGHAVTDSLQTDGSRIAEHHGTLGHVTLARLGTDGSVETFCTTGETAARTWMAGEHKKKPVALLNAPEVER